MINAIYSLFDTLKSIILFVVHSIESLFTLIVNIPKYTLYLSNLFLNVPNVFLPFLVASVSVYVIYLLTGRSTNG